METNKLQSKKQNLLGLFFCFFLDHKKVDGEFTDHRGYVFSGKCSRCGALYGHPKYKVEGEKILLVVNKLELE